MTKPDQQEWMPTTPEIHAEAIAQIIELCSQDTPTPEEDTAEAITRYLFQVIGAAQQAAYCDGWLDVQGGYEHSYGPDVEEAAAKAREEEEYPDDPDYEDMQLAHSVKLAEFQGIITFGDYSAPDPDHMKLPPGAELPSIAGFPIRIDNSLPPGTVMLQDSSTGEVLSTITGINTSTPESTVQPRYTETGPYPMCDQCGEVFASVDDIHTHRNTTEEN